MESCKIQEIPVECYNKFLLNADDDMDYKISLSELIAYIHRKHLNISDITANAMFQEICNKRHDHSHAPLTIQEIRNVSIPYLHKSKGLFNIRKGSFSNEWLQIIQTANQHPIIREQVVHSHRSIPRIKAKYEEHMPFKPTQYSQNYNSNKSIISRLPNKITVPTYKEAGLLLDSARREPSFQIS